MKTTFHVKCGFEPSYVQKIYGVGAVKCGFSPVKASTAAASCNLESKNRRERSLNQSSFVIITRFKSRLQ